MNDQEIFELCRFIRQTAYDIHVYLGVGFLEKVYENALVNRLRKSGLSVEAQKPIEVLDEDGTVIGDYFADIVVNGKVILELKVCKSLKVEHEAQMLNYLKAMKVKHGMLINFGSYKFQMKKFIF